MSVMTSALVALVLIGLLAALTRVLLPAGRLRKGLLVVAGVMVVAVSAVIVKSAMG